MENIFLAVAVLMRLTTACRSKKEIARINLNKGIKYLLNNY